MLLLLDNNTAFSLLWVLQLMNEAIRWSECCLKRICFTKKTHSLHTVDYSSYLRRVRQLPKSSFQLRANTFQLSPGEERAQPPENYYLSARMSTAACFHSYVITPRQDKQAAFVSKHAWINGVRAKRFERRLCEGWANRRSAKMKVSCGSMR